MGYSRIPGDKAHSLMSDWASAAPDLAEPSMNLDRILVIFQKEVLDNLRDRRTLTNSLFLPLLGPLVIALVITVQVQVLSKSTDKPLQLPIVGVANAPQLVQFLRQNNVEVQAPPPDPKAAVQTGKLDVVLVIPPSYRQDWQKGQPATLQLVLDDSRTSARSTVSRTRRLLEGYGRQIGALRLLLRGVSPTIVQAIAIEEVDTATEQSRAAFILNFLPYFIIFSAFTGGLYIAIDTTTGERERSSLEPLVITPVLRSELVLGKLAATLVFAVIGITETLFGFAVVLRWVPLEELGIRLSLNPLAFLGVFLITLPIALVASSLQIVIATFTRNFREALTYLSLIPLIPALPGLVIALLPIQTAWWMFLIPTFGQQLLINQLLRGEILNPWELLLATVATLGLGVALIGLATQLYQREEVLFSR